jgi:hypothetical protein
MNNELRFLAGLVGPVRGREDPPPAQRTLDLAYFDLDGLRRAVATAVIEASDRVVAFGVTYTEEAFTRRLCEWIKSHLGETQVKNDLNLRPQPRNCIHTPASDGKLPARAQYPKCAMRGRY